MNEQPLAHHSNPAFQEHKFGYSYLRDRSPPYFPIAVETRFLNHPVVGKAYYYGLENMAGAQNTRIAMKALQETVRPPFVETMAMHPAYHGPEMNYVDPRELDPTLFARRDLWLNTEYGTKVMHL